MQTCTARTTRMKVFAVDGKIPAIQGMPVIEEEDAKAIVRAVFAMRGADKKKIEFMKLVRRVGLLMWRRAVKCGVGCFFVKK